MRKLRFKLIIAMAVVILAGCGRKTSVTVRKAPLGEQKEQELQNALTGTWKLTHTKLSENTKPASIRKNKIKKWIFRGNGTGRLISSSVKSKKGKFTSSYDFEWTLKGRNLAYGTDKEKTVRFRVDDWSGDRMTWFHYSSNSYYILEPTE